MAENATNEALNTNATEAGQNPTPQEQAKSLANNAVTDDEFNRRVQAEKDRATADYGKRIASLQKELEEMKKEKMTADQRKQYDDEQREKAMAEKDRLLTERENRLTAIDELTKAKLYDGSDKANAFVNIVINGKDAAEIAENVKAIKAFVDEQVAKGVDETFKANGRTPNGGGKSEPDKDTKTAFAAELGKQAAETAKKSNEILSYYINGGKK
jgi:hypothetical protein